MTSPAQNARVSRRCQLPAGTKHSPAIKALDAAPFYSVAEVACLAWLAFILRLDAFISPAGTVLIYLTSASRISFGLSKNGYVPEAFARNSARRRASPTGRANGPCAA